MSNKLNLKQTIALRANKEFLQKLLIRIYITNFLKLMAKSTSFNNVNALF
jgi:hypothetical protein